MSRNVALGRPLHAWRGAQGFQPQPCRHDVLGVASTLKELLDFGGSSKIAVPNGRWLVAETERDTHIRFLVSDHQRVVYRFCDAHIFMRAEPTR